MRRRRPRLQQAVGMVEASLISLVVSSCSRDGGGRSQSTPLPLLTSSATRLHPLAIQGIEGANLGAPRAGIVTCLPGSATVGDQGRRGSRPPSGGVCAVPARERGRQGSRGRLWPGIVLQDTFKRNSWAPGRRSGSRRREGSCLGTRRLRRRGAQSRPWRELGAGRRDPGPGSRNWRGRKATWRTWEDGDLAHTRPAAVGRTLGRLRRTSRRRRPRTTTGTGVGARDWPPCGLRLPRRRPGQDLELVRRCSGGSRGSRGDDKDRKQVIAGTPGIAGRVCQDWILNLA